MSIAGATPPSRINTNGIDIFDHAINLIDTTKPNLEQDEDVGDSAIASDIPSIRNSGEALSRKWTRGTLREELARRKYAKWQEDKANDDETAVDPSNNEEGHASTEEPNVRKALPGKERLRDWVPFRSGKKVQKRRPQGDYEVDILYENQRGSFFCGIPLYSSNSLLNFDPSAWQNSAFKDSPINITNAQVPDPSWQWAWKSWYVDMSHDVDEEGWEYSFSFRHGFSWHGTHPWFHSFVRRRRWLRKRIKKETGLQQRRTSNIHMLNADYFTIHAKRPTSRDSSADRTINNQSSYVSSHGQGSDTEDEEEEINNILALMKALRKATVDRQKIESVKNFLNHGGDELYYLPSHMPEIMAMFIYQTSRRQLLSHLLNVYKSTTTHRDKHIERGEPESDTERRKIDSLLEAVHSAEKHVRDLEFWSDIKAVAKKEKSIDKKDGPHIIECASQGVDGSGPSSAHTEEFDQNDDAEAGNNMHEIKGIPDGAAIHEEPGINWKGSGEDAGVGTIDKGKGRA